MKCLSLVLGLLLLAAVQAQAQEMTILTVDQCIESALKKNALIGISQEHINQAQARIAQDRGAMLPVLSTDVYGAVSTDQPVVTWDTMIKQPLFLGGELIAKKEKAETNLAISKNEKILTQIDLAYLVRKTFFETKKAEADVQLIQEDLGCLKKLLDAGRKLRKADYLTQEVLLDRMASVGNKEKELLEGEKHLENLYGQVLQITGLDPGKAYVLEDMAAVENDARLSSPATKNQPLLDFLDLQVSRLEEDVKIAKSDLFPKVHLVSKYRKEKDSYYDKDALEAGVLAHWNIWDFGITAGRIQESKSKLAEGILIKDSQLQQYEIALRQARDILSTQCKMVLVNRQAVDAAEEQYKNAKVRYMHGDISDQACDAKKIRLIKAKTDLTKSIYDYYIGAAEVLKLSGIIQTAGHHE